MLKNNSLRFKGQLLDALSTKIKTNIRPEVLNINHIS